MGEEGARLVLHLPHPRGSLFSVSVRPSGISHQLLPALGPSQHWASIFGAVCGQCRSVSDGRRRHGPPGPQNTGVSRRTDPQSQVLSVLLPEGPTLGPYQGLSCSTRCCALEKETRWEPVLDAGNGAPGFNPRLTVCDLRPVFHVTATSQAVVIGVLSQLQNRGCRNGPSALATVHKTTRCSLPPPGSGRGKSLAGCGFILPPPRALLPPACAG